MSEQFYTLDIRIPNAPPQRVKMVDKLKMGDGAENDICIQGHGLSNFHCIWRINNEILSVHNLAPKTFLDNQELSKGKMYILDKGDKLKVGDLEIIIRQEIIEEDFHDEDEEDFDEEEDNNISKILDKGKIASESTEKINLFSKLKNKFKSKPNQKSNKKINVEVPLKTPHAFIRLYGCFADIALIYALINVIIPYFGIENLIMSTILPIEEIIRENLLKLIQFIPKSILSLKEIKIVTEVLTSFIFIRYFTFYFLLQLLTSLVFGQNLHLTLIGVGSKDNLVMKRLKAMARLIISLVTIPSIIFELPLLLGKRGLKEIITFSRIEYSGTLYKMLGLYILYPFFIIASVISPVILDKSVVEEKIYFEEKFKSNEKINKEDIESFESKSLNLSFKSDKKDQFVFLPLFSKVQKKPIKYKVLSPSKRGHVTFSKTNNLNFKEVTTNYLSDNLLSTYLIKDINTSNIHSISSRKLLLVNSLSLSIDNAHEFIFTNGPFILGAINVRRNLKEKIKDIMPDPTYSFMNINKKEYLKISPLKLEAIIKNLYFSLSDETAYLLEFQKKNKNIAKNFEVKILQNIRSLTSPQMKETSNNKIYGTEIADLSLSLLNKKKLEKNDALRIQKFYEDLKKVDYKKSQRIFQKSFNQSIESLIEFLNRNQSLNESKIKDKLIKSLQKLLF